MSQKVVIDHLHQNPSGRQTSVKMHILQLCSAESENVRRRAQEPAFSTIFLGDSDAGFSRGPLG